MEADCKFYKSRAKQLKKKVKILEIEKNSEKPAIQPVLITTVDTNSSPLFSKFIPTTSSGQVLAELLKKYKRTETELFKEIEVIMDKQVKHFAESTKHYQRIITNERKKMQNLSVMQSSVFLEKSELENLFLDCVEEVKKDISHRRAKSLRLQKFPLKEKSTPKKKEEIFSSGDKRKIMELLISNEQVLIMLYEKLFPFRASQFGSPQKIEEFENFDSALPNLEEMLKMIPNSLPIESPNIFP